MRSSATTLAALAVISSYQELTVRADDTINGRVDGFFAFCGQQLTALRLDILPSNDRFTSYTDVDGQWVLVSSGGNDLTQTVWTSGMVAGMFWYQFEATGDPAFQGFAEQTQEGLEGVELLDDNDLGFQVLNSFGLGHRLVGNEAYKARVLVGAESLFDFRYVANIPGFWSWQNPSSRPEWEQAMNVDMIMNMEIMLWAATNGGSTSYFDNVVGHADSTWKDIVRTDNSTFHVADYDPETGELVDQGTYQGYEDDSTWSRGQAWAIYGYIMVYRYLEEPRFLDYCKGLFAYFDENLRDDGVPYSDFDAPIDDLNPTDSSATAIVGSALFEIFEITGDIEYLEKAQQYVSALLSNPDYFDPEATDGWQAITRGAAAAWGDEATGSVTGDYFCMESLVRYKTMAPSILLRNEEEVSVDSEGTITFADLGNDVDISGLNADAPVIIGFGVTLEGAGNVPDSLTVSGATSAVTVAVEAPDGGWQAGANKVSFSAAAGTFSEVNTVESVAVTFVSTSAAASTGVTVDYLVLSHKLVTTLKTCADEGGSCAAPGDCCTGSCDESGTCTDGSEEGADQFCSDGTPGIELRGACCLSACGTCGGVGCGQRGYLASECCTSDILEGGSTCAETGEAPCIVSVSPSGVYDEGPSDYTVVYAPSTADDEDADDGDDYAVGAAAAEEDTEDAEADSSKAASLVSSGAFTASAAALGAVSLAAMLLGM